MLSNQVSSSILGTADFCTLPAQPDPAAWPPWVEASLTRCLCSAGCVITISGRVTFTSNKSMEIEVLVDSDPVVDNSQKRYRAASAFFTYVSLSQEGKSLPVPQLVVSGPSGPCVPGGSCPRCWASPLGACWAPRRNRAT